MSGTDHSVGAVWEGPTPAVLLVRPQMGENIGASARAMWNFGLDRMRIVAPRDGWPNEKAVAMASGAGRVLDNVRVVDQLADAADDLHYVYATTARSRDLTKPVLTPEEAMADAHARIARGENVGVVFGPERAGLDNDEVARANALISVPVNPAFGSLNLAQCVLLIAYEWLKSDARAEAAVNSVAPATQDDRAHLLANLTARLDEAGFFFPSDKAASMRLNLANLVSRLELTSADVRMLQGVVKTLGRGQGGRAPGKE